jgi:NAD(P)-dependent dehydrogenase (short-subunit alcohol dehydrogenase family)
MVAIVTGGGRGIGAAAAQSLASDGIEVVLVARSRAETGQVAAGIEDAGGSVLALAADVSEDGAADKVTQAAEEHFGRPCQILINAAGITGPVTELAELDLASFRRVIEINLIGALRLGQAVLPAMKQKAWGRIVNVTSGLAHRVQPGLGAYSTAKAALSHLSQIMDAETREHGVRVFALEPGVVRSRMNDQLRSLEPTGIRAGVVQMLRDIERGPGLVEAADSARLIQLTATGQADDLAGTPSRSMTPASVPASRHPDDRPRGPRRRSGRRRA